MRRDLVDEAERRGTRGPTGVVRISVGVVGGGVADGSEGGGTRTHDLGIKSPLLYQLSYAPVVGKKIIGGKAVRR
jgi:hypothetical protein